MGRISGLIRNSLRKNNRQDHIDAVIQLQTAVLLWGFTGVLGKAIHLNAAVLVIYRMLLTALIYFIYLRFRKIDYKLDKKSIIELGKIGVLMAIHWVAFYGAIKLASISVAMVCLSTASLFTVFVEAIWKKKMVKSSELILGMMALAGVVFIYIDNLDFKYGLIVGVLAALLSGFFTVMNKDVVDKYRPSVIAFYEILIGGLFLLIIIPILLMREEGMVYFPDSESWLYLFLLSFFCTFIGQLLALISLKKLSAFTLSLSVNLETFYGVILAFIFYQEQKYMGWHFYVGSGLIIASVLIQSLYIARGKN